MPVLLIIVGLIGLMIGSEIVVSSGKAIARKLGASPLLIGLTITSIGTSLPEIATNISAGFNSRGAIDASGIAVGNVIGSNLSQITLLLGFTALLGALSIPRMAFRRDVPALFIAMALMFASAVDGVTSRGEGMLLCIIYAGYLFLVWKTESTGEELPLTPQREISLPRELLTIMASLAVVVFSADLIVDEGVEIARSMGVSETVIGLGVGLTTGLPELAVALRSVQAKAGDLALGNLIGSNITDPLLSFGSGAMVHQVLIPTAALRFDFPFWLGATVLTLVLMAIRRKLARPEGIVLIAGFIVYVAVRAYVYPTG